MKEELDSALAVMTDGMSDAMLDIDSGLQNLWLQNLWPSELFTIHDAVVGEIAEMGGD